MKTRFASLVICALVLALALPQLGQAPVVAAAAPAMAGAPAPVALSALPTSGLCHQLGDVIVASPLAITHHTYLPTVNKSLNCNTGQSYGGFNPNGMADPPAAQSPDMNLSLRGYDNVATYNYPKMVVTLGGSSDDRAPRLDTMLGRIPTFLNNYQVYNWNWGGGPPTYGSKGKRLDPHDCPLVQGCWDVTMVGFQTNIGELVRLPTSGYGDIAGGVYYALVLYATDSSITLKYTSDDSVAWGYTIHVDNVCVDPNLLAAYNDDNNNHGRKPLPALGPNQPFGVAKGNELRVAIRDNGTFMDPRSRYDWWPH